MNHNAAFNLAQYYDFFKYSAGINIKEKKRKSIKKTAMEFNYPVLRDEKGAIFTFRVEERKS